MYVRTTGAQLAMLAFLFLSMVGVLDEVAQAAAAAARGLMQPHARALAQVVVASYTASLASFYTLTTAGIQANSLKDFAVRALFLHA